MTSNCNILVTGGAGYIGSHACKALDQAGFTPITYDNLSCGHRWAVKWGPIEVGDILDRKHIESVLRKYKPLAVMHFAASTYVGESVKKPAMYYRNNVVGSLTLLEAMHDYGLDKCVFSSTCATYGIPEVVPIGEDHPQYPINPYGRSKLMVEQMLVDFHQAYGLQHVILRYFNASGADPAGDIGESHEPETHLIPLVLNTALGGRSHINIYGDQYRTPDGTCIRDYIHVSDLADAHVKALNYLLNGGVNTSLNLGVERGYSVREVIEIARNITGRDISSKVMAARPGDPPILVSQASRAKEVLSWEPIYKELGTQILHTWEWLRQASSQT